MVAIDEKLSCKLTNVGFICAVAIVAIHVNTAFAAGSMSKTVHQLITAMADAAVPMFFVISGFLIAGHFGESGWWGREVRKRMTSLLIPYVFWNLFDLLFSMSMASLAGSFGGDYGGVNWSELSFWRVLSALGCVPPWRCQLPFLWFVRCLIVFTLIAPLFAYVKSPKWGGAIIFVEIATYWLLPRFLSPTTDWHTHFLEHAWMKGVLFFSVGAYLRWNGEWIGRMVRMLPRYVYPVLGFGVWGCCVVFGWSEIQRVVGVPVLMLGLWCVMPSSRWPRELTSSAFPIFLLHRFVLIMLIAAYCVFGLKEAVYASLGAYVIQIPVVAAICIGSTLLLRKSCPAVARIVFGGR